MANNSTPGEGRQSVFRVATIYDPKHLVFNNNI